MKSASYDRSRDLARRLKELRPVFSGESKAAAYLELFDDFLAEGEFGLALHALCDYLLEPNVPAMDPSTIESIRFLHASMDIVDECTDKLRARLA